MRGRGEWNGRMAGAWALGRVASVGAGLLALSAVPAAATPPGWPDLPAREECTAVMTVQKKDCSVEHLFRCPGDLVRTEEVELADDVPMVAYGQGALGFVTFDDPQSETSGLALGGGLSLRVTELAAAGRADAAGPGLFVFPFFTAPMQGLIEMRAELLDPAFEVDGKTFLKTTVLTRLTLNEGALVVDATTDAFVDLAQQVAFSGKTRLSVGGSGSVDNKDPVDVILPGEPGFLDRMSEQQCRPTSRLEIPTDHSIAKG